MTARGASSCSLFCYVQSWNPGSLTCVVGEHFNVSLIPSVEENRSGVVDVEMVIVEQDSHFEGIISGETELVDLKS